MEPIPHNPYPPNNPGDIQEEWDPEDIDDEEWDD